MIFLILSLIHISCSKRNVVGAANAILAAEMVLAGVHSVVPDVYKRQALIYDASKKAVYKQDVMALGALCRQQLK